MDHRWAASVGASPVCAPIIRASPISSFGADEENDDGSEDEQSEIVSFEEKQGSFEEELTQEKEQRAPAGGDRRPGE